METTAKYYFDQLLHTKTNDILDYNNIPLNETDLWNDHFDEMTLTHFNDPYDTLIYSNLISKALQICPGVNTVIDFGAGSSIPTLLAIKNHPLVRTIAVDNDKEAIEVGKLNARKLKLADRYTFLKQDIHKALKELSRDATTLIVSNPPYIAAPASLEDHFFYPINGGRDGAEYILEILNQDYPSKTPLALLWGSLTSPHQVMPLIEEKYEILYQQAYRIHFGVYTNHPQLRPYLYQMRDEGVIYFEGNEQQGEVQYVLGTILRRR
jgi:methylase of polypeptide subunit release factors